MYDQPLLRKDSWESKWWESRKHNPQLEYKQIYSTLLSKAFNLLVDEKIRIYTTDEIPFSLSFFLYLVNDKII